MIILTDRHHIHGLEMIVEENQANGKHIIAIGDMSATQEKVGSSESKLKEFQKRFKKSMYPDQTIEDLKRIELTPQQKNQAHEEGIETVDEDGFKQLLIWYGAGPIYNLARRIHAGSIMEDTGRKIIVYKGSEPIIAHVQSKLYEKLIENGVKKEDVMECILNLLKEEKPKLMEMVSQYISPKMVKPTKDISDLLLNLLSTENFDGNIPTSQTVYQKQLPITGREGFCYLEELSYEVRENTFVVHIPYFENHEESMTKIQAKRSEIVKELKKQNLPYCLILSHANPSPAKDMGGFGRIDHNTDPITEFCKEVVQAKRYKKGNIQMVTGHLHEFRHSYYWEDVMPIKIRPLSQTDIIDIDATRFKIRTIR